MNNNIKTVGQSNRKLADTAATKPKTAPAPAGNEPDFSTKLFLTKALTEFLASGEFELDISDDLIAGKFANRIAKLEARIAELEKAAGKPVATDRANTAALAKK